MKFQHQNLLRHFLLMECMSEGADMARDLKDLLPQHADLLESMAKDFDSLEETLVECDKSRERLNACFS